MPGPGGGGHGGGGGRGGFGGGSRGGVGGGSRGGFGGGFHGGRPGGMPPMGGGFGYRGGFYPRRRNRSGGCLGGLIGTIVFPLFFILMLVIYLLTPGGDGSAAYSADGYNEEVFQDYADAQYAAEFGSSSAYEDNLLITVLIDESYSDFYYIAWVGDHIVTDINHMLGNNSTPLGQIMNSCISASSYKYSLDSNLAQVMEKMAEQIRALELESSYSCTEEHAQVQSHLTNHADLPMTEATVNTALTAFTDATGIPVVIVVEDMADVFGSEVRSSSSVSVGLLVILAAVAVIGVVLLVNAFRKRGARKDGADDNPYSDFDDAY